MFELRAQQRPLDLDAEIGEQGSAVIGEYLTKCEAIARAVRLSAPNFAAFVCAPDGSRIFSAKW